MSSSYFTVMFLNFKRTAYLNPPSVSPCVTKGKKYDQNEKSYFIGIFIPLPITPKNILFA